MFCHFTRHSQRHRGIALPLVLICIVIATTIGAALLQAVMLHHRHAESVGQQQQSLWLAESGVQRAIHKLRGSPEYRGEAWKIPASTLGGTEEGSVTIQIEPREGEQPGWTIVVEATYPDQPRRRIVQQRELFVPVPIATVPIATVPIAN